MATEHLEIYQTINANRILRLIKKGLIGQKLDELSLVRAVVAVDIMSAHKCLQIDTQILLVVGQFDYVSMKLTKKSTT